MDKRKQPAILFVILLVCSLSFSLIYNSTLGENILFLSLAVSVILLTFLFQLNTACIITIPRTPLFYLLVIFISWLALSHFWSISPFTSDLAFWSVSAFGIVYLLTIFVIKETVFTKIIPALFSIIALICLFGLLQFFTEGIKPHSFFLNPNTHAALVNMLALPCVVFMLILFSQNKSFAKWAGILFVGFILFYSIAISQSRGVILAFSISFIFVFFTLQNHTSRIAKLATVLTIVVSFFIANIYTDSGVSHRIETLSDPTSAGSDRLVIWQAGLEMLKDKPLLGTGIGTFWLVYPKYRSDSDDSGGFHAHNDYLQLAIEAGLPGAFLFVLIIISLGHMVWKLLKCNLLLPKHRYELVAFFGALITLFLHSLFTFNFYVLPIMLMAGLYLGRIQVIYTQTFPQESINFDISKLSRPGFFRLMIAAVFLILVTQIMLHGIAAWYNEQGKQAARTGDLEDAEELLRVSLRLSPESDASLFSLADLYRQVASIKGVSPEDKKSFYLQALELLERARIANQVRPETYLLLGKLYLQNPKFDADNYEKAQKNFNQALFYNPRFHQARVQLALLLKNRDMAEAKQILEEGLKYNYPRSGKLLDYYSLMAKMYLEMGEIESGMEMALKVDTILESLKRPAIFSENMKKSYKLK